MRAISRKQFDFRKPLIYSAAALALFTHGSKAQSSEQQPPSYRVAVVPLAPGASTMGWPLAFNNAGQMVTSSYLNGSYGFQVSRFGSDGLKDIGFMRSDSHRGAFFINNSGQVAGRLNFGSEYDDTRAVFFNGQNTIDLGTLGGMRSYSTAINNAGQVVGTADTVASENRSGFSSNGIGMQRLNIAADSNASGINSGGDIVGSFYVSTSPTSAVPHAYAIRNGVFTDLGTMNGTESWATAINDLGHIIGGVRLPNYNNRAFRYKDGAMTDLGTLGGTSSEATDINAAGDVVGQAQTSIRGSWGLSNHAFLSGSDGVMRDLGALTGAAGESRAIDINDSGQIVGSSTLWDGSQAGFVYRNGQMYDLNQLIDYQLGWTISDAEFINNSGQIAATGHDANGNTRALLLSPNTLPVANEDTATVEQDSVNNVIRVLDNDTDADGDTLTLLPWAGAQNGTVEVASDLKTLSYTPNAGFIGSETFWYGITDGAGTSWTSGSVTVRPNGNSPTADNQAVETDEDTSKTIVVTAQATTGQTIDSYAITTQPSFGTLSGTAPNLIYTPNANYNGLDSFAFRAFTGTTGSNIATVAITIKPINDAPTADIQTITTNEDSLAAIRLSGSDVDGDAITFTVVGAPSHGALSGTTPIVYYMPAANYNGADSFTFKANDGKVDSAPTVISIVVTPVNDLPVAVADTFTIDEDAPTTSLDVLANDTDVEGDAVFVIGLVSVNDPNGNPGIFNISPDRKRVLFTPARNFNGVAKFSYEIIDNANSTGNNIWAASQVIVRPVNDAPISSSQSVATNEDTAKNITLAASDVDGDALTYSIVTAPANGTLSGSGASRIYTPNANYNGTDFFTFKANDGKVDSNVATVNISIASVNDVPIANNQSLTTNRSTPVTVVLSGSDGDGDSLTYAVVRQPSYGTLTGSAPNLTYTPSDYLTGVDSFSFTVNDGTVDSNTASVRISINPGNNAPVASNQSVTTAEDTAKNITLSARDVDFDGLTYSIVTAPTKGALSGTGANRVYTPAANYNGTDSFTFKANDGKVDSNLATVSISVTPVNDAPTANAQSVLTDEDTAKNITLSASDTDGDALTYSIVTQPSKGVVSGTAPNLVYTPNTNLNGADSFTFKANDGTVDSATATVLITIKSLNDAPTSSTQSVSTNEDTAKNITFAASDIDGDALTYSIVSAPTKGTLSGSGNSRVYTPNANANGTDSFSFKANDGTIDSNVATVNITIVPVNDAPTSSTQNVTTNEDTAKNIALSSSDIDGDLLTYSIVSAPLKGVLSGSGANRVYTPNANFNGSDSFSFKANDGILDSNVAAVNIAVAPVNDAPVAVNDAASTTKNASKIISVLANDFDVDGDTLAIASVRAGANGTVAISGTSVNYTPKRNYIGNDTFSYSIRDGKGGTATATVAVTIAR